MGASASSSVCRRGPPLGSEDRPAPARQRPGLGSPAAPTLPPPPFPPPFQARDSPRPAGPRAPLGSGHSQAQRFLSHLFRQPGPARPPKIETLKPHSSEKRGSTTLTTRGHPANEGSLIYGERRGTEASLRWLGAPEEPRKGSGSGRGRARGRGDDKKRVPIMILTEQLKLSSHEKVFDTTLGPNLT